MEDTRLDFCENVLKTYVRRVRDQLRLKAFTTCERSWGMKQSWKSGRAGVRLSKHSEPVSACLKISLQQRAHLSPVTVETTELIKSSIEMINFECFSHAYFAMPTIPRSCAYLDSLSKFRFGPDRVPDFGLRPGPGFKLRHFYNLGEEFKSDLGVDVFCSYVVKMVLLILRRLWIISYVGGID